MEDRKKDYRVRVTKMIIRKAFTDLLTEKPIRNITIRELCETAGINRGTFYTHYQDIYDLLEQIEKEMLQEFKENLNQGLETDKPEKVLSSFLFQNIFKFLEKNSDICTIMLGENSDKKFINEMLLLGKEECITTYSQCFKNISMKEIEDFYIFVSNGCIGLLTRWVNQGMKEPAEQIAEVAEKLMNCTIQYLENRS